MSRPGVSPVSPISFTYGYTANSNFLHTVTATAGAAHSVTNTWEQNRDILDFKENKVDVTLVSKYDYTVNEIGQRKNVARTSDLTAGISSSVAWDYDSIGQVTSADHSTGLTNDRGYLYDTIGNRRAVQNGAAAVPVDTSGLITPNSGTGLYVADSVNQYSTIPQAPAAPQYDLDGNMMTGPLPFAPTVSSNLHWDAENRLVEVRAANDTAVIASTLYDANFRRIAETVGSTTTLYVYDGWNCIAEYEGGTGVSPVLSKSRTWGLDLSGTLQGAGGVGGLLAERQGSANYFPTYDGNGNVSEYLNAAGVVAAQFEYDPFGNTLVNTDSINQFAYRFSTKPLNFATGLYYYGYRYYDPVTGRWSSRDPFEEFGGFNLYGFLGNDALSYFDYLGLDWEWPWKKIASAFKSMFEGGKTAKEAQEEIEDVNKKKYGPGGFFDRLADLDCDTDKLQKESEELSNETVDAAKKGGVIAEKALEAGKKLTEAAANGIGIPTSVPGIQKKLTPTPKF